MSTKTTPWGSVRHPSVMLSKERLASAICTPSEMRLRCVLLVKATTYLRSSVPENNTVNHLRSTLERVLLISMTLQEKCKSALSNSAFSRYREKL
ncbi:MAG: hypothetical protein AAGG81_00085 [Chlamydiota bacterium]